MQTGDGVVGPFLQGDFPACDVMWESEAGELDS
jgi:hypothetical protein